MITNSIAIVIDTTDNKHNLSLSSLTWNCLKENLEGEVGPIIANRLSLEFVSDSLERILITDDETLERAFTENSNPVLTIVGSLRSTKGPQSCLKNSRVFSGSLTPDQKRIPGGKDQGKANSEHRFHQFEFPIINLEVDKISSSSEKDGCESQENDNLLFNIPMTASTIINTKTPRGSIQPTQKCELDGIPFAEEEIIYRKPKCASNCDFIIPCYSCKFANLFKTDNCIECNGTDQRIQNTPNLVNETSFKPKIHFIECCSCSSSHMVGTRYKCVICNDVEICEICEENGFHSNHPLLKIRDPTSYEFRYGLPSFNGIRTGKRAKTFVPKNFEVKFLKQPENPLKGINAMETYSPALEILNSGINAWPVSCEIVCLDGLHKGTSTGVPSLKSEEKYDIILSLQAPDSKGEYQSTWRMAYRQHNDLIFFGEEIQLVLDIRKNPKTKYDSKISHLFREKSSTSYL